MKRDGTGGSLVGTTSFPAAVILVASLCFSLPLTAAEPQRRTTPQALTTLTIDYAVCSPNTYPDRIAMDSQGNLFVRHWGALWKVDPTGSPSVFSEVLETGGTTYIQGIAVDSKDNVFVTGYTKSPSFPATHGAWDRTCGTTGTCFDGRGDLKKDAFVAKIRSDGTLAWATFLGGGLDDEGRAIAVDSRGRAVVTGISEYGGVEGDFPVTPGAYQTTSSGSSDAFVTMLSADGSDLVFSTLLSDWYCPEPASVSLDPNGAIVVGGKASYHSVPVVSAFQSNCDAPAACGFVSEFSADGSALLFSTYLWGWSYSAWNEVTGVATGADGSVFAVGTTDSVYFPTTEGAFKCSGSIDGDAFVARFSPGGALLYSTYLGGSSTGTTHGSGIVVDSRGRATVVGETDDDSFPVTADAFQRNRGGGVTNGFVTTFNPSGTAVEFSSFLGGPVGYDSVDAIAAGPNGWLGLGGQAGSGFPVTRGSPPALSPNETTSFVARLTRSTSSDGTTPSVLTAGSSEAATIAVSVDPNADRHAVSPQIFGMNFGDAAQMSRLKVPVRRWGGSSVTRYNWETDTHNSASDWFFINYANGVPNPAALPGGSSADAFVDEIRAAGGEALITVPLIGWTPIDRVRRWGFSVAKYGAQQQTECSATGYPSWCNPDAGNGVKPDNSYVTANDPADTSKPVGPDFVTRWMAHLAGRVGTAAAGGVRLWALDNEPFLWNSTHHDVHPAGVSYDELWTKTTLIGAAVKTQDPNAKVLGPSDWGWCAYFFSGADGCSPGADRAAHGGMDFIPWYLQQAKAWETAHGTRLLDYLDIHYYPQAGGGALTTDESIGTSAIRLRTLKSLYDPTYLDESWIAQPVMLIPRMKAWIAAYYPGTKLAISEYNWGSDDGISGALAQAEALAIFGREGVDLATRWVAPTDNTKTEDAFLLYRNYDGAGAQVAGDSVRATSANVDAVGAYAIRGGAGGNTLYILLFNKDTAVQTAAVSVSGGLTQSAQLFRFTGAVRLAAAGTAAPAAGSLTLALPARSATLAVVALPAVAEPPPVATSFHTTTPRRILDTRKANGPLGGPALSAGVRRDFVLTDTCGIPSTAKFISADIGVTEPSVAGSFVAFPADQTPPDQSRARSSTALFARVPPARRLRMLARGA